MVGLATTGPGTVNGNVNVYNAVGDINAILDVAVGSSDRSKASCQRTNSPSTCTPPFRYHQMGGLFGKVGPPQRGINVIRGMMCGWKAIKGEAVSPL